MIEAGAFPENKRSIHVFQKASFTIDRIEKQSVMQGKTFRQYNYGDSQNLDLTSTTKSPHINSSIFHISLSLDYALICKSVEYLSETALACPSVYTLN